MAQLGLVHILSAKFYYWILWSIVVDDNKIHIEAHDHSSKLLRSRLLGLLACLLLLRSHLLSLYLLAFSNLIQQARDFSKDFVICLAFAWNYHQSWKPLENV